MDGSKVYEEFCAGRHQQIACYCMKDVELVREGYSRLTFLRGDVPEELPTQTP